MDNDSKKVFEYGALDASREIRLLQVSPADDNDDDQLITSSLVHARLDDCPSYIALSYVWGDAGERRSILVNSSVVSITRNLHEALTALRRRSQVDGTKSGERKDEPVPFWIDAVCINQANDAEKAVQVQLMQRIYRDAARVFIWLGPADRSSTAAMALLREIGSGFQKLRASPLYGLRAPAFLRGVAARKPGPDLRGLWHLFRRRPYWRRVWVIQEAVLARRATLFCGSDALDWDVVLAALRAFQLVVALPRPEAAVSPAVSIIADVNQDLSHFRFCAERFQASTSSGINTGAGGMALMEALWGTLKADIQSTDPRDRIFGLLGLVRDEDRALVPVDYSAAMTLGGVLVAVALALLRKHGPEVLCYCAPSLVSTPLPSWVVDWTAQKGARLWTTRIGSAWTGEHAFDASKGIPWDSDSILYSSHDPVLRLPGIIVGSISGVGSEFTTSSNAPEYLDACRTWFLEVEAMVSGAGSDSRATEGRLSNLWRLPIADKNQAGGRTGPEDKAPVHYDLLTGEASSVLELSSDPQTRGKEIVDKTLEYRRRWYLYDRRPFITNEGHPGLTLSDVKQGDRLCVLAGASVPFVIRPQEGEKFSLVGEAYVYGLMDAEAVREDSPTLRYIHLV